MDRKEFLSQIGMGAAGVLFLGCLGGCKKDVPAAPSNVNFTLDLSASANAPLLTAGGYVYSNNLIIAKSTAGTYLAVSQFCPHEGETVVYQKTQNDFYCNVHGSRFASTGTFISGPAGSGLKQYTVTENQTSGVTTSLTITG